MNEGKVWLIVGKKKMGKTFFLRSLLKPVHPKNLFLYDPTGQYNDFYKKPFLDFDKFIEVCTKVSGAVIAIEEGTINIGHAPIKEVKDFCAGSMNKGNTVFMIFHSLRTVPRYIYDLSEMIVLFKTKDDLDLVMEKFKDAGLIKIFKELQKAPMLPGKTRPYSPMKIYEI